MRSIDSRVYSHSATFCSRNEDKGDRELTSSNTSPIHSPRSASSRPKLTRLEPHPCSMSSNRCCPTTRCTWCGPANSCQLLVTGRHTPRSRRPMSTNLLASSIKDLHNLGALAAVALIFSRNLRQTSSPRDPVARPTRSGSSSPPPRCGTSLSSPRCQVCPAPYASNRLPPPTRRLYC
jgi:hypothetical protein